MRETEELIKSYYEAIMDLTEEQDIIDNLPRPEYQIFYKLINGLMLRLQEDYEFYEGLKKSNSVTPPPKNSPSDEEIQYELDLISRKLELCEQRKKEADEIVGLEEGHTLENGCSLVFAETAAKNICIEGDISSISPEFWPDIAGLIRTAREGITEDNTEKAKHLNGCTLREVHELKAWGVRLKYKILAPNIIYVLHINLKRATRDKGTMRTTINRQTNTILDFEEKQKILKTASPEEITALLDKHKAIEERILANLDAKGRKVK